MDPRLANPYPSIRQPVFASQVVATSQPLAAQAGLRMLLAGGNAIDAAVAAAAALTIVEPVSNGLGSDLFALVWDGQALHGLNASGPAPAAWSPDYFARRRGGRIPMRGWDSVTVPGAVAGWAALSRRFGRLPFGDLLAPAIHCGEAGHGVAVNIAERWGRQAEGLRSQPGFADAFLPRGRAPHAGEWVRLPDAAASLRELAATAGESLYRGPLATRLVAHAGAHGGSMTAQDLAAYQPEWVQPLQQSFAGHEVHTLPPNGQGISALMALGLLERLRQQGAFDGQRADDLASHHLQIESMKLAFADTYRWVADPAAMTTVSPDDLLSPAYLDQRLAGLDRQRAGDYGPGMPPRGGTVYLCTADGEGRMVSLIQSNYMGFGSGVVVPGTGISLQNRGCGFSLDPAHPNVVAGGKCPFHTIMPSFLSQAGRPRMALGVMGGNIQPQGQVQALMRLLVHGQSLQAACDAPRWKVGTGRVIDFEAGLPTTLTQGLESLGHVYEPTPFAYRDFGSGQFIWRLESAPDEACADASLPARYVAASDPRRDGQAVGV
ncbi:MAG: hypothetical protein RL722_207 [Pseudomonadota bacterium]|jgi:gamma-glutamyltranspeptidase/glutathione hydrolase